jgi:hypothetical protein
MCTKICCDCFENCTHLKIAFTSSAKDYACRIIRILDIFRPRLNLSAYFFSSSRFEQIPTADSRLSPHPCTLVPCDGPPHHQGAGHRALAPLPVHRRGPHGRLHAISHPIHRQQVRREKRTRKGIVFKCTMP